MVFEIFDGSHHFILFLIKTGFVHIENGAVETTLDPANFRLHINNLFLFLFLFDGGVINLERDLGAENFEVLLAMNNNFSFSLKDEGEVPVEDSLFPDDSKASDFVEGDRLQ
jgi:hypothetical protein